MTDYPTRIETVFNLTEKVGLTFQVKLEPEQFEKLYVPLLSDEIVTCRGELAFRIIFQQLMLVMSHAAKDVPKENILHEMINLCFSAYYSHSEHDFKKETALKDENQSTDSETQDRNH